MHPMEKFSILYLEQLISLPATQSIGGHVLYPTDSPNATRLGPGQQPILTFPTGYPRPGRADNRRHHVVLAAGHWIQWAEYHTPIPSTPALSTCTADGRRGTRLWGECASISHWVFMNNVVHAPSQWETTLQYNVVSHWNFNEICSRGSRLTIQVIIDDNIFVIIGLIVTRNLKIPYQTL